jgi:hypothetical protein
MNPDIIKNAVRDILVDITSRPILHNAWMRLTSEAHENIKHEWECLISDRISKYCMVDKDSLWNRIKKFVQEYKHGVFWSGITALSWIIAILTRDDAVSVIVAIVAAILTCVGLWKIWEDWNY